MWQNYLPQADAAARRICARHGSYRRHVDDAKQEARVALWRCSQSFDEAQAPNLWAYACLRVNGAVWDYLRSFHLIRRYAGEPDMVELDRAPQCCLETRLSDTAVVAASIQRRIDALPAHWQQALYLRHWKDLRYQEIAAIHGLTEAGAHHILKQAHRRLAA